MRSLPMPARYFQGSLAFFRVAELALKENKRDALIAPICQNLGLSLELMLKANGLRLGKSEEEVRQFGHDVIKMWNDQVLSRDIKSVAENFSISFVQLVCAGPGQVADPKTLMPPVDELNRHMKWLSDGYCKKTGYALRYPRAESTTVPSPEFLIPLFDSVLDEIAGMFG